MPVGALFALVVLKQLRELLFECTNFGAIADKDVGIVGVMERVVLVIGLGIVETLQGNYLGDDWPGKDLCRIKLGDVSSGNPVLVLVAVEDG